MNSLHDALLWRYAVKEFDPTTKLTDEERATIFEAIRMAPSAYGLQPFRVIVIDDSELRAKLRAVSYDQPKVTDGDCFLVFCARTEITEADVQEYVDRTASIRSVDVATLDSFKASMMGLTQMSPKDAENWSTRQAYLALGFGLEAAALIGVDAGPMEGFQPAAYDEILGLKAKGLTAKVAAAFGRRNPNDAYAGYKKVRHSNETMFIRA